MASYEQLPGTLNLKFRRGDFVSTEVDFSPISLTGHTVAATITSLVSASVVTPITTTMINAADGRVNISLTDEQTGAIPPGTYRWDMTADGGGANRTYLTGFVEVVP